MNREQERLENRLTIKFPYAITAEEIDKTFFKHLEIEALCGISYAFFNSNGKANPGETEGVRRIIVNARPLRNPSLNLNFSMRGKNSKTKDFYLFESMHCETSSIHEFRRAEYFSKNLPAGALRLGLIKEIKKASKDYFSQRSK